MTPQQPSTRIARYELTFPPLTAESQRPPAEVVVVHRTDAQGPGGHPVYSDPTGAVRAEISDRGECRMLSTGAHRRPRRPVGCRALPAADGAVAA